MGRPKLPRDAEGNIVRPPPEPPGRVEHPPSMVDGRPNPDHYRSRLARVNRLMEDAIEDNDRIPFNYEAAVKGIQAEAKCAGVFEADLSDRRSDREKFADALVRYSETPESIWEDVDAELEAVAAQMDNAESLVVKYVDGKKADLELRSATVKKLDSLRIRILEVLRLRERARRPFPPSMGRAPSQPEREHEIRAAHLLRFMVYVGRSNNPSPEPGGTVYRFGPHHAKIAFDIYEAQANLAIRFVPGGNNCAKIVPFSDNPDHRYAGAIVVCPPGHGKTELASHWMAREICFDPETQGVMLHAISEESEKNLRYVASCFDRSNSVGRRCMALFPVELAVNNNKTMRVKLTRPLKQNTLSAYGVMSGRLGVNTNKQAWDDIVPQSDVNEEATRKRRYDRVTGTWMTRQRGRYVFTLIVGTLWHYDDTLNRLIKLARSGKVLYRVSIQNCGGPKSVPAFRPLCPWLVSKERLIAAFNQSPAIYSAAYQSDPRSEANRIVRRLRLYDPLSLEHAEFMSRAVKYVSLDPSGTNRKHSDMTGLVYAGIGESDFARPDPEGGTVHTRREVLRILDAKEFKASQVEQVDFVRGYVANKGTDYVLIEQSGMSATADMLREYWGVDAIALPTGNKDKETRLRRVAPMLDEAQRDVGGPAAVVEFPGVRDANDRLIPDPAFKWLFDQILDFGVASGDHALDAVTQLCYYLMPQLRPGAGAVTEIVRDQERQSKDRTFKTRMLALLKDEKQSDPANEDAQWFVRANQGGY